MTEPEEVAPAPMPAAKRAYGAALKETEETLAELETYGAALCTPEEIAAIFGNELHQLQRLFEKTRKAWLAYQRGRATAQLALRKAQLEMAAKSVPMATALGKVYLGQSEREQDERPKNAGHGSVERLKRELFGVLAEASAEEGAQGD
jgi:hypothetical protein